jgi:hypothetical protein
MTIFFIENLRFFPLIYEKFYQIDIDCIKLSTKDQLKIYNTFILDSNHQKSLGGKESYI